MWANINFTETIHCNGQRCFIFREMFYYKAAEEILGLLSKQR